MKSKRIQRDADLDALVDEPQDIIEQAGLIQPDSGQPKLSMVTNPEIKRKREITQYLHPGSNFDKESAKLSTEYGEIHVTKTDDGLVITKDSLDGVAKFNTRILPNYIGGIDDGKMINDDDFSKVSDDVKQLFEDALGISIQAPPPNYSYFDDGLYVQLTQEMPIVSRLVLVAAKGKDYETGLWSLRLAFLDPDRQVQTVDIPARQLPKVSNLLVDKGLRIFRPNDLVAYLLACEPLHRCEAFHKQGLVQMQSGEYLFIHNGEPIAHNPNDVMYVPDLKTPDANEYVQSGTLEEWQEKVALPCQDSPKLVFMLILPVVALMSYIMKRPTFAFALAGESGSGKTTAMQVSASVMGQAGDPAEGQKTCIQSCRQTVNHLESVFLAHHCKPVFLDETGMSNARDSGDMIYMAVDGRTKGRARPDGSSQGIHSFHTLPIFTGEQSIIQEMKAVGGEVKTGHLVRLLSVLVDRDNLIQVKDGEEAAEVSDQLKYWCQRKHGVAFPEFVSQVLVHLNHVKDWEENLFNRLIVIEKKLQALVVRPFEKRAAKHFALTQLAGELMVEFDILPFTIPVIEGSVEHMFSAWVESMESKDDIDYALDDLKAYLIANQHKIANPASDVSKVDHIAYQFTVNEEAYIGFDKSLLKSAVGKTVVATRVYKRLKEQGYMDQCKHDRYTTKKSVRGRGDDIPLYMIKKAFIAE